MSFTSKVVTTGVLVVIGWAIYKSAKYAVRQEMVGVLESAVNVAVDLNAIDDLTSPDKPRFTDSAVSQATSQRFTDDNQRDVAKALAAESGNTDLKDAPKNAFDLVEPDGDVDEGIVNYIKTIREDHPNLPDDIDKVLTSLTHTRDDVNLSTIIDVVDRLLLTVDES